jgi:tetratricopeptide (TPR) repeat protein
MTPRNQGARAPRSPGNPTNLSFFPVFLFGMVEEGLLHKESAVAVFLRIAVVLSLLLTSGSTAPAAPTAAQIAKAVEKLGSNNFRQRQKASAFLWAAGKAAEPALQKALQSEDKEIVQRARAILDKFKFGIYPDTPKRVVELVKEYQAGNEDTKRTVTRELNKLGSAGHAVLIKLAAQEQDIHVRRELFDLLTGDVVPGLLADGRPNEVEDLLEMGMKGGDEQALRNYAAFLLLSGRLDAKIPEWARKAKKLTGYQAAEVLMYLYRAKGDLKKARVAARRTDKKYLLASILIEQGDWKELSANPEVPDENPGVLGSLGYTAAYHRLAGNIKDFNKAITAIIDQNPRRSYMARQLAIALLLNDRPREGIDLVLKNREKSFAFPLLVAQHRFKEAFDLVPAKRQSEWEEPSELARARAHAALGQKDKANKVLADYFKSIKSPKDCSSFFKVIETQHQLQLTEEAFAHCAAIVAQAKKEEQLEKLFGQVFTDRGGEATVWWKFIRQKHPAEERAASMKRLRAVIEGTLPGKDVVALAHAAAKAADREQPEERRHWLQALGETCLACKQPGQAQVFLEKAATAGSLTRVGDLLAEKKLWQQAAQRYRQAWLIDRSKPLPLYLRGQALQHAGLKEDGQKWMDLAHLLPLAQDKARFQFSQALAKRDLEQAAQRERELITLTGQFNYVEMSNALRFLGLTTYAKKDFDRAAFCYERTLLICLGRVIFLNPTGYLSVPASVHHLHARALLARGKIDAAVKEAEQCLASMPGDVESTINIVPALEKHDRKKEANAFFARVFNHYVQLCKTYPKSVQFHNSLAWVAVCCRRHLDTALDHARTAVELAPRNAGCLDTLAEIHYQRGDRAQAIKLMKKCIELDPKNAYFKKQIKRFEASGPASETPR